MSWNDLRKGRHTQNNGEYFITFNTLNRQKFFNDFKIAQTFCQQIKVNEQKHHCTWLTWVLMPEHFHGLLQMDEDDVSLARIIGELKGTSAYLVNKALNRTGKLWQPCFYDHALRNEENRHNIARYIVANPLRKNLVQDIRDYPYWNSIYL